MNTLKGSDSGSCLRIKKPSEKLLEEMVKAEAQMRVSEEYLKRCDEVADEPDGWLRITGEMQEKLVKRFAQKYNFDDEISIAIALHSMKTAHNIFPENPVFKEVPVYVRENKANQGKFVEGDNFVDTEIYDRNGKKMMLSDVLSDEKPNIVFGGSHT